MNSQNKTSILPPIEGPAKLNSYAALLKSNGGLLWTEYSHTTMANDEAKMCCSVAFLSRAILMTRGYQPSRMK